MTVIWRGRQIEQGVRLRLLVAARYGSTRPMATTLVEHVSKTHIPSQAATTGETRYIEMILRRLRSLRESLRLALHSAISMVIQRLVTSSLDMERRTSGRVSLMVPTAALGWLERIGGEGRDRGRNRRAT